MNLLKLFLSLQILLFSAASLNGQVLKRGKLSYQRTIEKIVDYKANSTNTISGKIFIHPRDTTILSVEIDTLVYFFEKELVIKKMNRPYSSSTISWYDFETMKASILSVPSVIDNAPKVTTQMEMFTDERFTQSQCGIPSLKQTKLTFRGYSILSSAYSCETPYSKSKIKGLYTTAIDIMLPIFPPQDKQRFCPIKLESKVDNGTVVKLELINAISVSKKTFKKLKEKYLPIIMAYNKQ